ncbi:pol-like protein [Ophiocordyceps camponoti-floridani]|uniref:Pol-like protein n=1 Tax=Ophiocordyceps camponoti-floridani TaxID=2030778 RepID=A0A8H4Q6H1_9HYPO|nr:pol-like protein [Ophiocordyceps camponoti-floridani]
MPIQIPDVRLDYHSARVCVGFGKSDRGPRRWRLPHSLALDRGFALQALREVQLPEGNPPTLEAWHEFKSKIAEVYRKEGKRRRGAVHARKGRLAETLETLLERPTDEPQGQWLRKVAAIKDEISGLERGFVEEYTYNARAKYCIEGEAPTRGLYERVKATARGVAVLPALKVPGTEGSVTTTIAEQKEVVSAYYATLWGEKQVCPAAMDRLLNVWDESLEETDTLDMNRDISEAEVARALRETSRGVSPGLNGLTAEWYSTVAAIDEKFTPVLT